jgi:hypothetical protein
LGRLATRLGGLDTRLGLLALLDIRQLSLVRQRLLLRQTLISLAGELLSLLREAIWLGWLLRQHGTTDQSDQPAGGQE